MARCITHTDPTKWMDTETTNGRTRVVCRLCGGFIGYRPPDHERRRSQRTLDDSEKIVDSETETCVDFLAD